MAQAQSFSYFARFRFENPSSELRKPEARAPPSIIHQHDHAHLWQEERTKVDHYVTVSLGIEIRFPPGASRRKGIEGYSERGRTSCVEPNDGPTTSPEFES
jgi:hypothetical protein